MGQEERARKIEELEQRGIFEEVLRRRSSRDPEEPTPDLWPTLDPFRRDLERAISGVARTEAAAEIGPLGVILKTVLFPDQQRREQEAASEAAMQKAIAGANLPPVGDAAASARSRTGPAEQRPLPPAPPTPPPVPHLPGLSPDQLAKVTGQANEISSAPGFPVSQKRRALPRGRRNAIPLPRWALAPRLDHFGTPANAVDVSTEASTPLPQEPLSPAIPGPRPPVAELPVSPLPSPGPLTASNADVLQPPRDPCECRKRPPRPSDKVPTIASYKRRMSQNSLDNLRRG